MMTSIRKAAAICAALVVCATPATAAVNSEAPGSYSIEQAISDSAQLNTLAFDALGFLTGNLGSDSFFPPGKVADFWGFQYLRDNDPSGMGHNTDFLTKASLNMLAVLTSAQRQQLAGLAKQQVAAISAFARNRFLLMTANRRLLRGTQPSGVSGLSLAAVQKWSAGQYQIDAQISVARARVMGALLREMSPEQRSQLDAMVGRGMTSWPMAQEPMELRTLGQDEKVAVMTYAGDMFSWYGGSVDADVYFCPERHATYFGSFYLKDAPAVGNSDYTISTTITGELGKAFVATLTPSQAKVITDLVSAQRASLAGIVAVRRKVATELRRALADGSVSASTVDALMAKYGAYDGKISYLYATAFVKVARTLTPAQRAKLQELRRQLIGSMAPRGGFLYATPIPLPQVASTDFLFAKR